ncbi:Protein F09F9.4 [Aphelenchoides avenae]|nr:Protein F09F9.4 [Aphelenchus avenae]
MSEAMPSMITALQIVMLSALFTAECREAAIVRVHPRRPSLGTRYAVAGLKPGETYVIERQLDPYEESFYSDSCQFTANDTSAHVACTCAFNNSGNYIVRRSISKEILAAFEIASVFDLASAQVRFAEHSQRLFESLTVNISLRGNSSTPRNATDLAEPDEQLCSQTVRLSMCLDYQANVTLPSHHAEWQCLHRQEISVLRTSAANVTASFDCASLSTPGFYRISVDNAVMSQTVFVNDSSVQPTLSLRSGSIFPYCNRDFIVAWTLPQCHRLEASVDFRLRVYSVADAVLDEWNYLEEFPVGPSDRSLSIPCSQFDILYEKFCFELVSVHRTTKKFHQWDRRCINTEPADLTNSN